MNANHAYTDINMVVMYSLRDATQDLLLLLIVASSNLSYLEMGIQWMIKEPENTFL